MTDLSTIPQKVAYVSGAFDSTNSVSHIEVNKIVSSIKELQKSKKAFAIDNQSTGYDLAHGFGTAMGLTVGQYALDVRAYDSNGELSGNVLVSKTNADLASLNLTGGLSSFTGTLILEAIPF